MREASGEEPHRVGAFKSTDRGQNWTSMSSLSAAAIWTIAIDPADSKVLYAGTNEDGVWTSTDVKRFLISVPASAKRLGEVDEINPLTMQITNRFVVQCDPAGLALGPLQRVMTSCGYAFDGRNGNILANANASIFDTNTIGGDEIWFNPGDNRYCFGNSNVGVVDAETNQPLGFVTTGVPTHSIAVDSSTNHIFVPATGIGVEVFAQTPCGGSGGGQGRPKRFVLPHLGPPAHETVADRPSRK